MSKQLCKTQKTNHEAHSLENKYIQGVSKGSLQNCRGDSSNEDKHY